MRNSFIFNGINCESLGIFVEDPIAVPIAKERFTEKTVMGSSKVLFLPEGMEGGIPALDPVSISISCVLRSGYSIDTVARWLRGNGDLIVCGDEGHAHRAIVANQISLSKILRARPDRRFTVEFRCEGWRYHYPPAPPLSLTSSGFINNPGTGPSEPLITVYGSGSGDLMVGSRSLLIDDMNGEISIDCDARLAYEGTELVTNKLTRVEGWPIIPSGSCAVNWSGGITQVVIEPRWRDY